jgi:hypothetical protein
MILRRRSRVIKQNPKYGDSAAFKALHCEQGMVDAAESYTGDNEDGEPQFKDEVRDKKVMAQGDHGTSHPLDDDALMAGGQRFKRCNNDGQFNGKVLCGSSNCRGGSCPQTIGSNHLPRILARGD